MQNNTENALRYRGRFAPAPTGPLHFGSLVAAVGSFLQARAQDGEWHLRIEDLDRPRIIGGTAEAMMRTLERLQMYWDGPVRYQQTASVYAAAFAQLAASNAVYACACSRREIADSSVRGIDGAVYPGACRTHLPAAKTATAWRVRTEAARISFNDSVQGLVERDLERDIGDFIVRRADGRYTYQLAVVVDDAMLGVTEIVRGADLLESTARQIHLQKLLGFATPRYVHLPVVVNAGGEKLSKQTHAAAIDANNAVALIYRALQFLGQAPPRELMQGNLAELWVWARAHWRLERTPRVLTAFATDQSTTSRTSD